MKNIKPFILILPFVFCLQSTQAQITGVIPGFKSTALLENIEGVKIPVKADQEGRFKVNTAQLKKGFYTITDIGTVYLEPSYSVAISKVNKGYVFTGVGAVENNLIQEFNQPIPNLQTNSGYGVSMAMLLTEPDQFIPLLDAYEKEANLKLEKSKRIFFKTIKSQDIAYAKRYFLFNYIRFYGLDSTKKDSLNKYLRTPLAQRTKDHAQKQYKAYLAQFTKKFTAEERKKVSEMAFTDWDPNNELLFKNSGEYRTAISNRLNFLTYAKEREKLRDSLKSEERVKLLIIEKELTNPYINEYFTAESVILLIKKSTETSAINDVYAAFMKRPGNPMYKEKVSLAYQYLKGTEKNALAPDFSYPNSKGTLVTLKSMRGKYVYIDLWATWCVPCIAELPDLKKLGVLYGDKKISFVSISVNEASTKQVWLDFLEKNNLPGIQLMADQDFSSDFVKKFGVNSIPRFILIGPDGRVIDNDAKRPSNPALVTQLNGLFEGDNM
ncbi:TlpA family protein disulfide reductase [Pedobacter gandavensis]|uniref:Redoxin family protein n=1 Tax=Pedobacter gandavensis TaxID=2679963 RepID=A0ABR6EV57_9SPHI|nr:TlpA disulfide reductase family protein [Pedobacter gandavensis]MBB2148333.1 redoxin family protein [Pedobacter gandavensis]